jgi:subtilisin family serine protease
MHLVKSPLLFTAFLLLLNACDRDRAVGPGTVEDECLTRPAANSGTLIEGQYIVAYRDALPATGGTANARVAERSQALLTRHRISDAVMLSAFAGEGQGFCGRLTPEEAARLRADPAVEAVEPDRILSLAACFTVVDTRRITWGVRRTGYGDGTGKTAWIIDSGIDLDHPDLNVDVARSRTFIRGGTSADDDNGHGTHVAGVIGALNNRIGTLGVASGARLVALKVMNNEGEGWLSNVIAAVAHAGRNGQPGDVVNLSLGGEGTSAILDREVQAAAGRGILFAIAAGNERERASLSSPGRVNHQNVVTVTAMDSTDAWARFSNFGNDVVDYCAPGVRIASTYRNGGYAIMSGTSMAAPHVAGLLLLRGRSLATGGYVRNDPDGTPDPIASW